MTCHLSFITYHIPLLSLYWDLFRFLPFVFGTSFAYVCCGVHLFQGEPSSLVGGSLDYLYWGNQHGIKQYKCMVILRDLPIIMYFLGWCHIITAVSL